MTSYGDKKKIGGKINSKIANQDSLASVFTLEQLNCLDIFDLGCLINDFCIKCEGDEDLEIFNQDEHIFIQVKSASISKSNFMEILADFMEIDATEKNTKNYFVLVIFENLKINGKNIKDHLDDYLSVRRNDKEIPEKRDRVKMEFIDNFGLSEYSDLVDRLKIELRPLFRDGKDTKAIFARTLRLYYRFTDPGDVVVDSLFTEMTEIYAEARRNRRAIQKNDLEIMVNKAISKQTVFSDIALQSGYKKIENGYVKDKEIEKKLYELSRGFYKARKKLMKGWRKSHWKEVFKSLIVSAKSCPQCGHPMMANIMGLNGIACPDCGFNPYVSMVLFCECGEFEVIKSQPKMDSESQIKYIKEYFSTKENNCCKNCNKNLFDEYLEARIFYAPVPYPYDELIPDEIMYKDSKY